MAIWKEGRSRIEFFDIDIKQYVDKYNAGFPVRSVQFSWSGRFLCITGDGEVPFPGAGPVDRLIVVDREKEFKRLFDLTGEHNKKKFLKTVSCAFPGLSLNHNLSEESVVNHMLIIRLKDESLVCRKVDNKRSKTETEQFWDLFQDEKPELFLEFTSTEDILC